MALVAVKIAGQLTAAHGVAVLKTYSLFLLGLCLLRLVGVHGIK
jgi:hypothetical protein